MASTVEPRIAETLASPGSPPVVSPLAKLIQVLVVGTLLLTAFWPILTSIYGSWFDEHAYMEHGILVVPAAAYMAWTKRDKLQRVAIKPSMWGVVALFWGAMQAVIATAAQWVWVSRTAFLISVAGAIAAVYGWNMVRELTYPLCTLLLMIAPPTFVFERLTLDLQLLASRMGEFCLEALGYSVMREGNVLEMVALKLSVEEACSGIRSLVSIIFMCVLYNYSFVRGNGIRTLILALAVPVAILGNAGRIVATGIAGQYNHELVQGTAHEAFGYVSVVIAGIGCVALHLTILQMQKAWRSRNG